MPLVSGMCVYHTYLRHSVPGTVRSQRNVTHNRLALYIYNANNSTVEPCLSDQLDVDALWACQCGHVNCQKRTFGTDLKWLFLLLSEWFEYIYIQTVTFL